MSKSGLADSPFFAPAEPKNEVLTPPSTFEQEKPTLENKVNTQPESLNTENTKSHMRRVKSKRNIGNSLPAVSPKTENNAVMNESLQASNNASMQASNH